MTTKKNIYEKLNDARIKFHALELKKSGHNKFAGYTYFELGDFVPEAVRIFAECGLCSIVSFTSDTATMKIVATDDGSQIEFTSPMGSAALKGCHEVQNIGAVETYQRRYLWTAVLEIVEHDALDAQTGNKEPEPKKEPPFVTGPAKNKTQLKAMARELGSEIMGCGDADELDIFVRSKDASELIEQLKTNLPSWWEGEGDSKGISGLIQQKQDEFNQEG